MLKVVKYFALSVALIILAIQFIRPEKSNPPVDETRTLAAHTAMTPAVEGILQRACMDCHSNQTRWPWYSQVAPVSWMVIDHVNDGREELNLSNWADYDKQTQAGLLGDICATVKHGKMPLPSYINMHAEAALTVAERQLLCEWATAEMKKINHRDTENN